MTIELRPFAESDADWVVDRHAEIYARDEGYDATFRAVVAEIVAGFLRRNDKAREMGWIAWQAGQRIGCIFCVAEGSDQPDMARLRLFLLEPAARGTGLAQTMMDTCLGFARDAGFRRMRLWTHESLHAAVRLYERNGFSCVSRQAAHAFGQSLVDQIWERNL